MDVKKISPGGGIIFSATPPVDTVLDPQYILVSKMLNLFLSKSVNTAHTLMSSTNPYIQIVGNMKQEINKYNHNNKNIQKQLQYVYTSFEINST